MMIEDLHIAMVREHEATRALMSDLVVWVKILIGAVVVQLIAKAVMITMVRGMVNDAKLLFRSSSLRGKVADQTNQETKAAVDELKEATKKVAEVAPAVPAVIEAKEKIASLVEVIQEKSNGSHAYTGPHNRRAEDKG